MGKKWFLALFVFAPHWLQAQQIPHLRPQLSQEKPGSSDWQSCWDGCSLGCGLPWRVTASSQLADQGANHYGAAQSQDGNVSTAWAEGAPGDGRGEWLECEFYGQATGPINFSGVALAAGYQKSVDSWLDNGRPKQILLQVNGQDWAVLCVQDTRDIQTFHVTDRTLRVGDKLRLLITQVYPGRKFTDCCITEFTLHGAH